MDELGAMLLDAMLCEDLIGEASCVRRSCLGRCTGESLAFVHPDEIWYHRLSGKNLMLILREHVLNYRPSSKTTRKRRAAMVALYDAQGGKKQPVTRLFVFATENAQAGPFNGPFMLGDEAADPRFDAYLLPIIVGFVRTVAAGVSRYNKQAIEKSSNLKS